MTPPSAHSRLLVVLLLLGAFAQVTQGVMLRELMAGFYGSELAIGAFYGSWLGWIGMGGWLAAWLARQRPDDGTGWLQGLLLLLPMAVAAGVAWVRLARLGMALPTGEFMPMGAFLLVTVGATLPAGLLLGMAFPVACRVSRHGLAGITRLYLVESLGALAGGVLFSLVLVETLGSWRTLAVAAAGLAAGAIAGENRKWLPVLLALAYGLLATDLAEPLRTGLEQRHFQTLHPGLQRVDGVESRHGQVVLARLGEQYSVVHDGKMGESFPNVDRARLAAAYYLGQAVAPRHVLLLGGVESGLVEEILRYPVDSLTLVQEDPMALAMVQPWLPAATRQALTDVRLTLVRADARAWLHRHTPTNPFELVLVLAGEPVNARQNRLHTREFHAELARRMAPAGVICTQVSSASNYMGQEIMSTSAAMDRTLAQTFAFRTVAPGDHQIFCAAGKPGVVTWQADELARRHRAFGPRQDDLPAHAFDLLLPDEQTRAVRNQLAQARGEINTDTRPIHFYLNLLLWSKFTHSEAGLWLEKIRRLGALPYVVPAAVFFLLLSLRGLTGNQTVAVWQQHSAMAGVAVAGLAAMGLQLMLIHGYQSLVGHVYSQVALLNGVFMAGLALGAGILGQRWPPRAMIGLLLLVAGLAWTLPWSLDMLAGRELAERQVIFPLLCASVGVVTGAIFPMGVILSQPGDNREAMAASGLVEAADHLGGAVGGLLVGSLLIPLLGMTGAGQVMALLAAMSSASLAMARAWPMSRFWQLRLGRWPGYASVLAGVGLTALLLAGRLETPPQTEFTAETLQEVAGHEAFIHHTTPFPHDLGNRSLVLASQPLAGDIRGYAGTLNLLVALDRDGRLLTARHLHSHETPSYIEGIDAWLAGLAGHDFTRATLQESPIDSLSGATITSRAALAILDRTARLAGQQVFGLTLAAEQNPSHPWQDPLPWLVLGVLLLFFPVHGRGRERERLGLMLLSLLVLGVVTNALWHEVDVANLSLGRWPSWSDNPIRLLVTLFVIGVTLLLGQVYCGFLCPFGALQEFFSRWGQRLGLARRLSPEMEASAPWLRATVMVTVFSLFWLTGDMAWVAGNPMQQVFGGHLDPWLGWITGLTLAGSLIFFRYWCRWFCPLGGLLALGNRLALLARWLPGRRLAACDLGVAHPFDAGCLHCHRCLGRGDNLIPMDPQKGDNLLVQGLWLTLTVTMLALLILHGQAAQPASGWRRIDTATLQRQVREGRLADREALWYHPVP